MPSKSIVGCERHNMVGSGVYNYQVVILHSCLAARYKKSQLYSWSFYVQKNMTVSGA